jgi:hypothetical protein
MHRAAHVLSVVLHPVWMPAAAMALLLRTDPMAGLMLPVPGQRLLLAMVFLMTAVFPATSMLMMRRSGAISALSMPLRRERVAPYAVTLVYFGMCYWLLRRTPVHPVVLAAFTGILASLVMLLLALWRWKWSAHMAGLGGVAGLMIGLGPVHGVQVAWLPGLFVLAGVLGSARLLVTDHRVGEVVTGFGVGLCSVLSCLLFRLYL